MKNRGQFEGSITGDYRLHNAVTRGSSNSLPGHPELKPTLLHTLSMSFEFISHHHVSHHAVVPGD